MCTGAAGDPASLGISALLIGKTDQAYYDAAIRQADHLLNDVPRWENGAISHREAYPELWADFVYMVPPFLAYYAIASSNLTLAKESALQCQYYRDGLTVTSDGVWLHIRGTHGTTDLAAWSSGNGWAAAGMSRVLATLRKSKFDAETKDEQIRLVGLIKEILDGAIKLDVDESELLRNYLDDASWFGEISGTSLLAATAFRVAVLAPEVFGDEYTQWAERKLDVVDQKIDEATGIVGPAVNPLNWHDTNEYWSGSPEGQSFVVLMHAAYRDWEAAA
jgi:rhamnogalacturonyl hydrolase YesR